MRALFCGGRNWSDRERIRAVMGGLAGDATARQLTVIHGAARGADTIAGEEAERLGLPVLRYPAQWDVHGRAAGHIRNREMLEDGKPDLVCAFHDDLANSKGTGGMVRIARAAGVPVRVYTGSGSWSV